MNSDTLRKAVELAKGWSISANGCITLPNGGEDWYVDWPNIYLSDYPDGSWKVITDALAAQLVRQVDALADQHEGPVFCTEFGGCALLFAAPNDFHAGDCKAGPAKNDRTENTIRAIVESGVLEDE